MSAPVDLACVVHCTRRTRTARARSRRSPPPQRGRAPTWCCSPTTTRSRRAGGVRSGWHGTPWSAWARGLAETAHHYLAFGLDAEIDHAGLTPAQIVAAVPRPAGSASWRTRSRAVGALPARARGMPWGDLDADGYRASSCGASSPTPPSASAPGARPRASWPPRSASSTAAGSQPRRLGRAGRRRPVVGIGGWTPTRSAWRIAGRVPVRLMGYARSFRQLRTHCCWTRPLTGDARRRPRAIYAALRAGRCYLALDSLAPARGFAFWARRGGDGRGGALSEGVELNVGVPRPASITLLRDGEPEARTDGTELQHRADGPGVWRVEARSRPSVKSGPGSCPTRST